MTTATLTSSHVDAEVRGMVRPPLPNYALRRLVVAGAVVVASVVVGAVAVGLPVGLGSSPASASEVPPAPVDGAAPTFHVAVSGDTLWSIASAHRGDVSHRRYLDALIRLNGGTTVLAGQAVRLP